MNTGLNRITTILLLFVMLCYIKSNVGQRSLALTQNDLHGFIQQHYSQHVEKSFHTPKKVLRATPAVGYGRVLEEFSEDKLLDISSSYNTSSYLRLSLFLSPPGPRP